MLHANKINSSEAARLSAIVPNNQEKIIKETGSPLNFSDAYNLIMKAKQDLGEDNPKLIELDAIFHEKLTYFGFYKADGSGAPTPTLSKKQVFESKKKAVEIALKYAKGEKAAIFTKKLKAIEIALKYAK